MKNGKLQLMLAGLFLCAASIPAFAQEKSREDKKLETSAGKLDKDAGQPEGEKTVTDKLKSEFKVDDARVQSLRDQKLGYGEVSIVLALAQGLPGGITDVNVQKVLALRQGPPVMGWGKVTKSLGLKLGPVQSKVHKIAAEARKQEKGDKIKKDKKAEGEKGIKDEKGMKGEKMDKPEKPDKPVKAEKMERPEKPENTGKH
jgi:hypothetical protein